MSARHLFWEICILHLHSTVAASVHARHALNNATLAAYPTFKDFTVLSHPWKSCDYFQTSKDDCVPDLSPQFAALGPCEYFGFQYSMEYEFQEVLMSVTSGKFGKKYVLFAHCVSVIVHKYGQQTGWNMTLFELIQHVETAYFLPVVKWARNTAAHRKYNGRNFFTVFAMDLGRQDFPKTSPLLTEWSIGSLTGDPQFMARSYRVPVDGPHASQCANQRDGILRGTATISPRNYQVQDFVIFVSSRFGPDPLAKTSERTIEVFFAGTANSCTRKWAIRLYKDNPAHPTWLITDEFKLGDDYSDILLKSEFCLIFSGSSHTNNVRLVDSIMHGCIPVVISDDFQPSLDPILPWHHGTVFLPETALPTLPAVLASITRAERAAMRAFLIGDGEGSSLQGMGLRSVLTYGNPGLFWSFFAPLIKRKLDVNIKDRRLDEQRRQQKQINPRDIALARFVNFLERNGVARDTLDMILKHTSLPGLKVSSNLFGCADTETLIPVLHMVYRAVFQETQRMPGLLIDAGANVGKTTTALLSTFSRINEHRQECRLKDEGLEKFIVCPSYAFTDAVVISLEPLEKNYVYLNATVHKDGMMNDADAGPLRAKISQLAWLGLQSALGAETGRMPMAYHPALDIDEVATLVFDQNDTRPRTTVRVATVEDVVQIGKMRWGDTFDSDIFLLKLDIEGMEPAAIRAADALFTAQRITFVVFEHTISVWREPLENIIAWLWERKYVCFFITDDELYPVSGTFWHRVYNDMVTWSNVFCGVNGQKTKAVYRAFHLRFTWQVVYNTTLDDIVPGTHGVTLYQAQQLCSRLPLSACLGVTCMCDGCVQRNVCTLRRGLAGPRLSTREGHPEVSYLRPGRHKMLPFYDQFQE